MRLKKLRLTKGLSQEKLSEISGVSVRTIQRIEKGNVPSLESAKSLAQALNVSPSVLLEEVIEKTADNNEPFKYIKLLAVSHFLLAIIIMVISMVNYFEIKELQEVFIQTSFSFVDILIVIICVWAFVNILSGYLLIVRKSRAFCMVVSVINLIVFPFGTVLGVLTLYYLSRSEVVKGY